MRCRGVAFSSQILLAGALAAGCVLMTQSPSCASPIAFVSLHGHGHKLRDAELRGAVPYDLAHAADDVGDVEDPPIVFKDAPRRQQAALLDQVGQLPGGVLLADD